MSQRRAPLRMEQAGHRDAGFVLVDALVAVTIVSAAGVITYTLGHDVLRGQERALDRSVAVATIKMLARQMSVSGELPEEIADPVFSYRLRASRSTDLSALNLVTIDAISESETISVSLVVPVP